MFGKYQVTGLLGAGANGQVYLARHQFLEQDRAIKRIPKSSPSSSGFRAEADLLKSLSHPGIPSIYDVEEDDEYYYIIEEYVRGESLEAYVLHQTTISLIFLLQVGRQLCDILEYLHALPVPVIYQDLKPEHVILDGGRVRLVDFGIASQVSSDGVCHQYGTARYAAPEKRLGISCDERTDIYGIGTILRFMERYLPKKERPASLRSIIGRALELDKGRRFASVAELSERLDQEITKQKIQKTRIRPGGKKHLIKNMAVIGMRAGIGTTHVAVSFDVYLRGIGTDALYVEQNRSGDLYRMAEGVHVRPDPSGEVSCGSFKGTASQGKGSEWLLQETGCLIRDFGAYEMSDVELETCDGILLVLGGRPWEAGQAAWVYERLRLRGNLIPIVNYGNAWAANEYARHWRRNVYCFPLDADPMILSVEKRRFFETLQKNERWW